MGNTPARFNPSRRYVLGGAVFAFILMSTQVHAGPNSEERLQMAQSVFDQLRKGAEHAARDAAKAPAQPTPQPSAAPQPQAAEPQTSPAGAKPGTPAPTVSTAFNGEWYSPTHRYGFRIEGNVGTATVSNSPAFKPGDVILKFKQDWPDTFIGEHLHTDGTWYRVRGQLGPDGTIQMDSALNQRWVMSKGRAPAESQASASRQSASPAPTAAVASSAQAAPPSAAATASPSKSNSVATAAGTTAMADRGFTVVGDCKYPAVVAAFKSVPTLPGRLNYSYHPTSDIEHINVPKLNQTERQQLEQSVIPLLSQARTAAEEKCGKQQNCRYTTTCWAGAVYLYAGRAGSQRDHIPNTPQQMDTPGLVLVVKTTNGVLWDMENTEMWRARRQGVLQQEAQAQQKQQAQKGQYSAFLTKHGVKEGSENMQPRGLYKNVFAYKGQTVILKLSLGEMITETRGIFGDPVAVDRVIISEIPPGTFKAGAPGTGLIAGTVLGNIKYEEAMGTGMVVHLKFRGSLLCADRNCTRFEER
jgi:hypothetical protein